MSTQLTILGFNSAIPTAHSAPTSQFLKIDEHYFLIDCGEGTQVQIRKAHVKFSRISRIFISHLHGDHSFGLFGLVASFRLLGRKTPLHIYGPKGIEQMVRTVYALSGTGTDFELIFHELSGTQSEKIFEDEKIEVWTIPLDHRVYCNGYLFKEKLHERKLNMAAISKVSEIEICDYANLKKGRDFVMPDGTILANEDLTLDPPHPVSYAFCSDTRYKEDIIPIIRNVTVLYHETTFLNDLQELADQTGHSTAKQAAIIAKKANVGKLICGHFSNRYNDLSVFVNEAQPIFPNSVLPVALQPVEITE